MPPFIHRLRRAARLILTALLLPLVIGAIVPAPRIVHADAAFVVDSTADTFLMGSPNGICDDGSGHCTLREALIEAYYASGAKTITFANSILPATINLVNGTLDLPGDDVLIDGPGASSLTIDASALGPGSRGFAVTGNGNTIQHLRVDGAPEYGMIIYEATSGSANNNTIHDVIVTGSGYDGIVVHAYYGVGGAGNSVTDSLIGVGEWSDTACDETQGNDASGLWLSGKIRSTLVQGNRIVCNGDAGIYVVDTTVTDTDILDNRVGTDGDHAMGNGFAGLLSQGSDVEIEGNLVSGNAGIGIWVNTGDGVQVTGNKIGTNASGSAAIPNGGDGVYLGNLARNVVVGSASDAAARNLVSGNGGSGIAVSGTPTSGNPPQIDGNLIGLDAAGTAALPNATAGLYIVYVDRPLTVGVDGAAVDQIISGNDGWGIRLYDSQNVTVGSSNYVGVAADHTTPMGNGGPGIGVAWANSSTLTPAVVAHNGGGIIVEGDSSSGILIRPGDIHGNGGIAVDLGYDGPSANDPGDLDTGPNDLLNYPEISAADGQLVSGSACLGCSVFVYEAVGDPTAIGGGGIYLMQVSADAGTGAWEATLPGALTAWDITLMASQVPSPGNTSEMSPLYNPPHFQLFLPLVLRNSP
jgi:parallel beta-helix repeat protein